MDSVGQEPQTPLGRHNSESFVGMQKMVEHDHTTSTEALDKYAAILESHFPRAVPEEVFINTVTSLLGKHGYTKETSINLVSTCRDEICRPFVDKLDKIWSNSFNISSLGGLVFCGRTGFKAAMAHAPVIDGKERYVFWVAPHVALSLEGTVGKVYRTGREHASSACGALLAVQNEIKGGRLSMGLDPTDMEQSLLKQQIVSHLRYGHVPSLVELTYAAYECIVEEVKNTANASVDTNSAEYVIVAGIQVHGPMDINYFWPGSITMIRGNQVTDLYEEYAASVSTWSKAEWADNNVLRELQARRREARLAAKSGNIAALKKVKIDLGSVVDNQKRSLLHVAAIHGQQEVADMLLKLDVKLLHAEDIHHMTAMDYAVIDQGSAEVANCLLKAGAKFEGETLRTALFKAVNAGDMALLRRYVKYAGDRDAVLKAADKDGRSLVHVALSLNHYHQGDILEFLLQLGGGQNEVDFYGNDLLHDAKRVGSRFALAREISPGKLETREPSPMGVRRFRGHSYDNIQTFLTLSSNPPPTGAAGIRDKRIQPLSAATKIPGSPVPGSLPRMESLSFAAPDKIEDKIEEEEEKPRSDEAN